jgi:error-prone DNA polymerase
MQDLPRHLGQHSGGMVICQGELDAVVPLEPASMPGRVVVQWDKDDCADMGIVKVDLLGLGMMAVLQDALALVNTGIRDQGGREIGPGRRDPRRASRDLPISRTCRPTIPRSTHAAEGRHHRRLPGRVARADGDAAAAEADDFYDLVVEVAIIRPGPIVGRWCIRI